MGSDSLQRGPKFRKPPQQFRRTASALSAFGFAVFRQVPVVIPSTRTNDGN